MVVTASGCALTGHPAATPVPRVLGETKGTPLVLGQPAPVGTGQLGAVSCATDHRCWAVGVAGPDPPPAPAGPTVIVATTNGGRTWKAQHVTGGATPQLSGISCPTATSCMAVGSNGASLPGSGVVVTTQDGGRTWAAATTPASALTVSSVSCATTADCTAIVSQGTQTWSAHSTDFGQTWQQEGSLPGLLVAAADLTCVAGGTCLVAGYVPTANGHGEGAIALSDDGGQTWALASVPAGIGLLQSTACVSATECLAAGTTTTTASDVVPAKGELLRSDDGGHTWTPSTGAPPVDDVYGVACPDTRQCAMVGTDWVGLPAVGTGAVAQSVDGGQTFRASKAAYVPLSLTALACPTSAACVAVGGNTVARLALLTPPRRTPSSSHSTGSVPSSAQGAGEQRTRNGA